MKIISSGILFIAVFFLSICFGFPAAAQDFNPQTSQVLSDTTVKPDSTSSILLIRAANPMADYYTAKRISKEFRIANRMLISGTVLMGISPIMTGTGIYLLVAGFDDDGVKTYTGVGLCVLGPSLFFIGLPQVLGGLAKHDIWKDVEKGVILGATASPHGVGLRLNF